MNREPNHGWRRPAGVRSLGRVLVLAALLVAAAALAACGSTASTAAPTGPLASVETRGGECLAAPCGQTVTLERDGTVHVSAKPPNTLGTVTPVQLETLSTLIASTDFAAITAHPFTGQCPTTFDGQEYVFEFAAPGGPQRIATCEVQVDWGAPLFVALSTAFGPFVPLPTT